MASNALNVEVFRVFVNAKGERKEGREPRTLSVALEGPNARPNTEDLRAKIGQAFPRLDGRFHLFWKGPDGDFVPLSSDRNLPDIIEANADNTLRLYMEKDGQMATKVHPNVVCDGCDGKVEGARFKCLECPNFDLCSGCEGKGMHSHHVMVKGYRPVFFNKMLPEVTAIRGPFPSMQGSEGEAAPRPSPRQMRQFWQQQGRDSTMEEPLWKRQQRQRMHRGWRRWMGPAYDEEEVSPRPGNQAAARQGWGQCMPWQNPDHPFRHHCHGHPMRRGWRDQQAAARWMGGPPRQAGGQQQTGLDAMRPAWIQKCREHWREKVIAAQPKDQAKDPKVVIQQMKQPAFRAFMRHCWQVGIQMLRDAGREMPNVKPPKDAEPMEVEAQEENSKTPAQPSHPKPPRRVWIDKCWDLWQQLFHDKEDKPSEEKDGEMLEEEKQHAPWKAGCPGGPFPLWRQFLRQSWVMLLDVAGVEQSPKKEAPAPADQGTCPVFSAKGKHERRAQQCPRKQRQCHAQPCCMQVWQPQQMPHPQMQEDDFVNMPLEKMRPAWIQRSQKIWRERWMSAHPKQHFDPRAAMLTMEQPAFRALMRQCWRAGKEMMAEAGREMPNLKHTKAGESMDVEDPEQNDPNTKQDQPEHPRRRWINQCWDQWQQMFHCEENDSTAAKEDEPTPGDKKMAEQSKGCPARPLQKWRQFMRHSWTYMLEEFGVKDRPEPGKSGESHAEAPQQGTSTDAPAADKVKKVQEKMQDLSLDAPAPAVKQQQLRKNWIQNSRLLWKAKVMDSLPKGQPRAPQLVMRSMKLPAFREYMRPCWQAGVQMLKKAGVELPNLKPDEPQEMAAEPRPDEKQEQPQHPRKKWMIACWDLWQKDISVKDSEASAERNAEGRPKIGRPWAIQKWRCFMRRSWQLMLQELGVEDMADPDDPDDEANDQEGCMHALIGPCGPGAARKWQMMKRCPAGGHGFGCGPMGPRKKQMMQKWRAIHGMRPKLRFVMRGKPGMCPVHQMCPHVYHGCPMMPRRMHHAHHGHGNGCGTMMPQCHGMGFCPNHATWKMN